MLKLGGTDAACVMGHGFKSRLRLYLEKRGEVPPMSVSGPHIEAGNLFEDAIAVYQAERTGRDQSLQSHREGVQHPVHEFMSGHPDYSVEDAVVEVKHIWNPAKAGDWGEEGSDEIPPGYAYQGLHYAACLQKPSVLYWVFLPGRGICEFRMVADKDLTEHLIDQEWQFVQMVESGQPPDPASEADARMRWFAQPGKKAVCDDILIAQLEQWHLAKQQRKVIDESLDRMRFRILMGMQDATELVDAEGKVLATARANRVFDEAAFKAAQPELHAQYTVTRLDTSSLRQQHHSVYQRFMRPPKDLMEQTRVLRETAALAERVDDPDTETDHGPA